MDFTRYLAAEWKPALGCTEPAAIAYAAALAAAEGAGAVRSVHLVCDPRMYKNCYAVGIPHSEHRTGIQWTAAIGALLPDPGAELECFRQITPEVLAEAQRLIDAGTITVGVDAARGDIYVDCRVVRADGVGRAVLEGGHTNVVQLERDGLERPLPADEGARDTSAGSWVAEALSQLDFDAAADVARSISAADRERLRRGCELNLAIARHGLSLFPKAFMDLIGLDQLTRISRLVCAGVYARMSGEDFTVMTLAGSGNKGITVAVPLTLWGQEALVDQKAVDEALALACLITSQTTLRLGTLSAACGCASAAGIGLAVGLVLLQGGDKDAMSLAVNNMVGNVTGMICDGAKMGCGLKTMTSVDAAFRAASLALAGVGIPATDGIV
ncbi:MAG: L-serine ammonia-lyase, iron-sulfur-dependent, subunit alpha, partial [Planctomycetota bacterium]|nr:L-serine ammonia-lyase, iron-sulfur-dependent, subunit alpha [Planctomycetota bacterium]